jgi:hypothetical protein
MSTPPTLLTFNRDGYGSLVKWLEKIGLREFLKSYPITDLIEWGWLIPQYRVTFPSEFFEAWVNYPYIPCSSFTGFDEYSTLWGYTWTVDKSDIPLWFLDPVFRKDDGIGKLLHSCRYSTDRPGSTAAITHSNGRTIYPDSDYFFRWQGYALIDVIRAADCFNQIYSTPDVVDRALRLVEGVKLISEHSSKGPEEVLALKNRWGGLAEPMTWLAHFRSFHDAFFRTNDDLDPKTSDNQYRKGAHALAGHLNITHQILVDVIEEKLLPLAHSWMESNKKADSISILTQRAWPSLREDIEHAVRWLIIISGKPFIYYVDKWEAPCFGNIGRATLDEVLPYRFLENDRKFAKTVPHYLRQFNALKNNKWSLTEEKITLLCRNIRKINHPFSGFLASFYELHENLSYKRFDQGGIDFRELRPLDHFAMLAIHAEGCLRRELDSRGMLDSMQGNEQTLSIYIEKLANVQNIPKVITNFYISNKAMTNLRTDRSDPIGKIESISSNLAPRDRQLAQAFLCCLLARNYFAHHDFLDKELLKNSLAEFLLRGILLTVLTLLDTEAAKRDLPIIPQ